jgi:hypothetical protein
LETTDASETMLEKGDHVSGESDFLTNNASDAV